jgi:hypothetical protein
VLQAIGRETLMNDVSQPARQTLRSTACHRTKLFGVPSAGPCRIDRLPDFASRGMYRVSHASCGSSSGDFLSRSLDPPAPGDGFLRSLIPPVRPTRHAKDFPECANVSHSLDLFENSRNSTCLGFALAVL